MKTSLTLTHKTDLLLTQHGFPNAGVLVQWNKRLQTTAGRAHYGKLLITLNPALAEHKGEVRRTFLHELAHILNHLRSKQCRIPTDSHGPNWRHCCVLLGIPGEDRCHSLELSSERRAAKWELSCPSCDYTVTRKQRPKRGRQYSCKECGGSRWNPNFTLILKPL